MSKRIYVGLSKISRTQLASLAQQSGVPLIKLENAARQQVTLTETELKQISRAVGRPRTE